MFAWLKKKVKKQIAVMSHTKVDEGQSYFHTAIINTQGFRTEDKGLVASIVSRKVGFDPIGYGLYHVFTKMTPTGTVNEFKLEWKTSNSCD
jgi:hypothetical protein